MLTKIDFPENSGHCVSISLCWCEITRGTERNSSKMTLSSMAVLHIGQSFNRDAGWSHDQSSLSAMFLLKECREDFTESDFTEIDRKTGEHEKKVKTHRPIL